MGEGKKGRKREEKKEENRVPARLGSHPHVRNPEKYFVLLGDRGTQVQVAWPRPLCNGAKPELKPVTSKSEVRCHIISTTESPQKYKSTRQQYATEGLSENNKTKLSEYTTCKGQ